jgi:tRNA A-37 threonylcarbamoyl transferase component Bud32
MQRKLDQCPFIAKGAFGHVHEWLDCANTVVKLIDLGDDAEPSVLAHFRDELDHLERLEGLGVAPRLVDAWICPEVGLGYIVQERVEGVTLHEFLTENEMPKDVLMTILKLMRKMHDAGIVHTDLHPGNIMLAVSGPVRFVDFGEAFFESEGVNDELRKADLKGFCDEVSTIEPRLEELFDIYRRLTL